MSGAAGESASFGWFSLLRFLLGHSPRRCTIGFIVLPDRVVTLVRGWCRLNLGIASLTRLQLHQLVRSWHMGIYADSNSRELEMYPDELRRQALGEVGDARTARVEVARILGEMLQISAIGWALKFWVRALTIVPDNALHSFPFAVLPFGDGYIIERFAIDIGFAWNTPRARRRRGCGPWRALLIGVGKGDVSGRRTALPGVGPEIEWLRRFLTGSRASARREIELLRDLTAVPQPVLDRLECTQLAHFACHGKYRPEAPSDSGLVLDDGAGNIAMLTIRDIWERNLGAIDHVTLSACWSADGYIHPSRIVVSLPEIFRRRGAHSVLASLWRVDDRFAQELMARFYQYLRTSQRGSALRRTQLDCLKGNLMHHGGKDRTDPYFWAGLQLYGEPGYLPTLYNIIDHINSIHQEVRQCRKHFTVCSSG